MKFLYCFLLFYSLFPATLISQQELTIKSQKSGPFLVNSYLIFDPVSKEAAFIDAGSLLDTLMNIISSEHLKLKYIFLTHAHQDHITGVNEIVKKYPEVKTCLAREEYKDFRRYKEWRKLFDLNSVAGWQKDSSIVRLMDYNYKKVRKPDNLLTDNQQFMLGEIILTVVKTPGHSKGGVTLFSGNCVFPGDLILYHSTGYLDYPLCSRDEIVTSIRKIYSLFPDSTVIYSGHGKPSTIGYEKVNNKNVTTVKEML